MLVKKDPIHARTSVDLEQNTDRVSKEKLYFEYQPEADEIP